MAGLKICERMGAAASLSLPLRKGLWEMNRTYRPANERKNLGGGFKDVLSRIATGDDVAPAELLPHVWAEDVRKRAEANALLADAYFQAGTTQRLQQAKVFMQRAWLLSGGTAELLPLYIKIFSAIKDTAAIRDAYKRLTIEAARHGDFSEVARYFNLWQYAYPAFENVDRYAYDVDVLHCVDEMAARNRINVGPRPLDQGKIRVAHLIKGMTESNSILIKIDLMFAEHHDRSQFELAFFTPDPLPLIKNSPHGEEHLRQFKEFGFNVVTAPDVDNLEERLVGLARAIAVVKPHILVTSAALADFDQYFVTTLRPAPFVLGLVQGPPPQFAPPTLDWCIAFTKHPFMDSPVNCSLVELKLDYSPPDAGNAHSRETFGLPDDACVLISGGRYPKFQSHEFWQSIADLLSDHPSAYFVAVGPRDDEIPFLNTVLPKEVRTRVSCLGWRKDFFDILAVADILIDTYPSGGGQVIVQGMSLGIPIVSHRNNYMQIYDQSDWNPVEDFIKDPEIIVPRGDFEQIKRVVGRLIEDKEYRREVGLRCRAQHVEQADPTRDIRKCEEVYKKVLRLFPPTLLSR